jgi:hypothetical protein
MTGVVSVMRKRWLDRHEIKAALGQPRSPSFCFRADWSVAPMSLRVRHVEVHGWICCRLKWCDLRRIKAAC